ncbi:hypothetical protein T492DRAFT_196881 [Pavlovales sp. CCMP2436]|nr:hypothetical protein T492DRAFT_196881 [Pavlovales sp. CCMP2436]
MGSIYCHWAILSVACVVVTRVLLRCQYIIRFEESQGSKSELVARFSTGEEESGGRDEEVDIDHPCALSVDS